MAAWLAMGGLLVFVALYFALGGGLSGAVIGVFYSLFTLTRLVFFTRASCRTGRGAKAMLRTSRSSSRWMTGIPTMPMSGSLSMRRACRRIVQHTTAWFWSSMAMTMKPSVLRGRPGPMVNRAASN